MGDYAVLTYEATINGVPLGEAISEAPAQLQGPTKCLDSHGRQHAPAGLFAERSSE